MPILVIANETLVIIQALSSNGSSASTIFIKSVILVPIPFMSKFLTELISFIAPAILLTACAASIAIPQITTIAAAPAPNNKTCGPITAIPAKYAIPATPAINNAIEPKPSNKVAKRPPLSTASLTASITFTAPYVTNTIPPIAAIPAQTDFPTLDNNHIISQ